MGVHSWRSKDEIISDVFLRTPTHGLASFSQPTKTDLHQLCADTRCGLEDLLGVIKDRDGEKESGNSVQLVRLGDDDDLYEFG